MSCNTLTILLVGCIVESEPTFLPILVTLQFAEALFICLCCKCVLALSVRSFIDYDLVFVAAWKAARRPVDHGRLSIQPTLDLKPYSNRVSGATHPDSLGCRGWWDYMPPQSNPVHTFCTLPCRECLRTFIEPFSRGLDVPLGKARKLAPEKEQSIVEPPRVLVVSKVSNVE